MNENNTVTTTSTDTNAATGEPVNYSVNEEQYAAIVGALSILHGIVGSKGVTTLPTFDKCGEDDYSRILDRAGSVVRFRAKQGRSELVTATSAGIRAVIDAAWERGHKAYDAINNLPAEARAMLKAEPADCVYVNLREVSHCFPQGTSESQMVKVLHDMGYQMVKGAKSKDGLRINVPLFPTVKEPKAKGKEKSDSVPAPAPSGESLAAAE